MGVVLSDFPNNLNAMGLFVLREFPGRRDQGAYAPTQMNDLWLTLSRALRGSRSGPAVNEGHRSDT